MINKYDLRVQAHLVPSTYDRINKISRATDRRSSRYFDQLSPPPDTVLGRSASLFVLEAALAYDLVLGRGLSSHLPGIIPAPVLSLKTIVRT